MLARDIMTTKVVSVAPDTPVEEIAKLLLEAHVSAVPVVDSEGHPLGIVSEGDLILRDDEDSKPRRSWWLEMLTRPEDQARDFIKWHGHKAKDVMSSELVTVDVDASHGEIARLLEERRIKRVPVLANGKLVGIVSRADLLRGLAAHGERIPQLHTPDDRAIRERIQELVMHEDWITYGTLNAIVANGVVDLWGLVDSEEERRALKIAVEEIPGVTKVEDHLGLIPPYLRGT